MQCSTESKQNFSQPLAKMLVGFPSALELRPGYLFSFLRSQTNFLDFVRNQASPCDRSEEPYSRRVLFSGPEGEVMVARWRPEAACAPHDHGESHGVVLVLSGILHEQSYTLANELYVAGPELRVAPGDCLPVSPGEIHRMRADTTGGITLHFYAPPIRGMNVYDEKNGTIYTVGDDCGAWIPHDRSLIREIRHFNPLHHSVS